MRKQVRRGLIWLMLALLLQTGAAHAAPTETTIRIAVEAGKPPYTQLLRDITLVGAEQSALEVELYVLPGADFRHALTAPGDTQIDWFAGVRQSEIEQHGFVAGPVLLEEAIYIFSRRSMPHVADLGHASGYVLGVVANSSAARWVSAHHTEQTTRRFADAESMLAAALAGELHVFLASHFDLSEQGQLSELLTQFPLDRRVQLFSEPRYLAARHADTRLAMIQSALEFSSTEQLRLLHVRANSGLTGLVSVQLDELIWLDQRESIRVGVPDDSTPVLYFNRHGEAVGLDADFLGLIESRTPLSFNYVGCGTWEQCIEALARREIDVLSFLSDTAERRDFAVFTSVYWQTPWALASSDANPVDANDLDELQGKTLALTRGYVNNAEIAQTEGIKVVLVDAPGQGLQAVLEGKADAYMDSLPLLVERMREQHTGTLHLSILRDYPGDQVNFAVRNDWPVLRDVMQRAVDTLTYDDRAAITERWFDVQYEEGLSFERMRRWLIWGALIFVAVVAAFWFWNSQLRREVRRRMRAERRMRYLARHDELTGLPNRHLLRDSLQQTLASHERYRRQFALLFLDLDGFKAINDELGHDIGDELLKQVASRLRKNLRKQDILCRFGGDEFVVVLTEQQSAQQSTQVAEKLVKLIVEPYQLKDSRGHGGTAEVSVSIGVAMYPQHGDDAATLMRRADKAMYEVKSQGKNGVMLVTGNGDARPAKDDI
ncbi:diguanylate cyclase domain-containing protein [Aliidiomarina soli]|uniref:GGDEF domain-containing protein n=1 Tax=Aliidiomarina soli TaxID=1928574 RepID=A0A432WCZ3_9GAMM|nr:diguanylate cyclase [Aliidiomarina soli]RUO30277.1 hypothetical protein CWE14_12945 [Aliidiomarina soli]